MLVRLNQPLRMRHVERLKHSEGSIFTPKS